ncbi:DUF3145 domain-containing protein [Nakamurella antarctica]|uniref:DUF3145 domain-containing protein n=1 Tax=Nakamurella antarctica TaxID=1902245 RepID=A0A3G8ZQH6_9ACTN|nr:DUF3145 domain-containing protein [Nakamurella antarctica]
MGTRGVIYVHSALPAICPHVEWAISGVLGVRVSLSWTAQPAAPGQLRAEATWVGERGTGAKLAAALRSWAMLRFEVTEDPSVGQDGERICHLPGRGIWRAKTSANGDVLIGEDQIRSLMVQHPSAESLRHALEVALGTDIDGELENFRSAGEGSAVTWLHQVG